MGNFQQTQVTEPTLRMRLFGVIEAWGLGGESVLPRGRKAQAILCYLALCSDAWTSRQRLVDLLWSSRWPEQARASLRQSLLEIRNTFGDEHGDIVTIDRDRVSLDRNRIWIDGVSSRTKATPVQAPRIERLLETLVGLDPRFDDWILTIRQEIAASLWRLDDDARPADPRVPVATEPQSTETNGDDADTLAGFMVAVTPFLRMGQRVEDYLAPALTQEIVTALARCRWMRVRLNPSPRDSRAKYRLEGYVTDAGEACRVVVRLIDQADRDIVVWTGAANAAYPIQYEAIRDVVERVVEQLDPETLGRRRRWSEHRR